MLKWGIAPSIAVALAIMSAPADAAPTGDAAKIVGRWHGAGWQPLRKMNAEWLDEFRSDGTYTMTVVPMGDCTQKTMRNEGIWSYAAGVLTMQATSVNAQSFSAKAHTYRMKKLAADAMSFDSDQTGVHYDITSVSEDFSLPACRPK
jgi:hypothetical protein